MMLIPIYSRIHLFWRATPPKRMMPYSILHERFQFVAALDSVAQLGKPLKLFVKS